MSTHSRIGIVNSDGTITSIYCHFDGYERGQRSVGQTLLNHYKDETKIRQLMELGDLSRLGTDPIENPNAWSNDFTTFYNYFEKHPVNTCDAYKTRGEKCPATRSTSIDALLDKYHEEYTYIFKSNEWQYITSGMKMFESIPKED